MLIIIPLLDGRTDIETLADGDVLEWEREWLKDPVRRYV